MARLPRRGWDDSPLFGNLLLAPDTVIEYDIARHDRYEKLAAAYKEGLEAGRKEEAERRMEENFDEINQGAK